MKEGGRTDGLFVPTIFLFLFHVSSHFFVPIIFFLSFSFLFQCPFWPGQTASLPIFLPSFSMERTNKVAPIAGPLKQKLAARHELEMGLARTLLRIVTHPLSRPPPPFRGAWFEEDTTCELHLSLRARLDCYFVLSTGGGDVEGAKVTSWRAMKAERRKEETILNFFFFFHFFLLPSRIKRRAKVILSERVWQLFFFSWVELSKMFFESWERSFSFSFSFSFSRLNRG